MVEIRRPLLLALVVLATLLITSPANAADGSIAAGGTTYNGIGLPDPWPPQIGAAVPRDPVPPPYLLSPPAVIPIDVGRQLFVDDFLIDKTDLKRTFHTAKYYQHNPVLKPDRPWEMTGQNPCAMVFSDGVFYDPADRLFKMWYMAGYVAGTGYATSTDGIHWTKPELDVVKGTNLVQQGRRDSGTVWLDHQPADPAQRFKMALWQGGALGLYTSADGVHFKQNPGSGGTGDRTTFYYNPFRQRWVYSLRADIPGDPRVRRYWEAKDFLQDAQWKLAAVPLWTGGDNLDPKRDDLKTPPQLYNLDCVAYESLLVGLFSIWRGQPSDRAKPNEVCLGFSRDGFHWQRPDRRAFIPVSERHGDWNWGNVQSAGGGCLVVGDELYFYVSGRAGVRGSATSGVCTTGLATLRRDGFASLSAGEAAGQITTRPVRFAGRHLFVNVSAGAGQLRAEVLDESGKPIAPFTLDRCTAVQADTTRVSVKWKGADDLAAVAGKPVRLRFEVKNGDFYAFWVSPDSSGASNGYVAAGGPGLPGPVDTVGGGKN